MHRRSNHGVLLSLQDGSLGFRRRRGGKRGRLVCSPGVCVCVSEGGKGCMARVAVEGQVVTKRYHDPSYVIASLLGHGGKLQT